MGGGQARTAGPARPLAQLLHAPCQHAAWRVTPCRRCRRPPARPPQGKAWYATERARLERMIASGSVSIDKLEGMVARSSALGAFLGNKVVAPAGGDKDEEAPDATEPYVEEEEDEEEDEEEEDEEDEDEAGSEEL
jgi:ribosomal protein L12E/L44/L45/RPP1/RPP2